MTARKLIAGQNQSQDTDDNVEDECQQEAQLSQRALLLITPAILRSYISLIFSVFRRTLLRYVRLMACHEPSVCLSVVCLCDVVGPYLEG